MYCFQKVENIDITIALYNYIVNHKTALLCGLFDHLSIRNS